MLEVILSSESVAGLFSSPGSYAVVSHIPLERHDAAPRAMHAMCSPLI